ncbi:MAG TPA: ribosome maturation factor RimM [Ignavibacteriaceae bacterium]
MIEYFLVAKIVSAEGDKGFLKIDSFSDSPERFAKLKNVYIDFWGEKKLFSLQSVKRKKENILIKFKNFDDKESVEVLIGREVFIDSKDVLKLPKGHYFIHDIIGSNVIRNGVEFGKLTDVYSLTSNDVYVIRKTNGEEILIPAIHEFIESIDTLNKVLILKSGEDFYEDDED